MSITSAPFLFLYLPAVVGIYYLISSKRDLRFRNIFLILASLFFYIWGEPAFIFLLVGMIVVTWCFGRMAFQKRGTCIGKTAVLLTVIVNLVVILFFGKNELIIRLLGKVLNKDFSWLTASLPIGFSFFIFSSISYVVDMYRGQCESSGSILQTALYTSAFFRILQGPIISYRKFESQIQKRPQAFDLVGNGIWRISIGLCKKIIIADNLALMVDGILTTGLSDLAFGDAWLGCIAYLVYMYFDLSGYADMAIGLAESFGFSVPENFNYPYISTSISEFWRRWHITLCAWFTEYLYYPLLLGPSIKLRKFLQRHNVCTKIAKTLQNIFVMASVWVTTALWHGMNLRYAIWGIANCTGMLIEPHIKPLKNKRLDTAVRYLGMLLFLCFSMPLIGTNSFGDSLLLYRAMFAGSFMLSETTLIYLRNYGIYLLVGIIGCFPVLPYIKRKIFQLTNTKYHILWDISAAIMLMILVCVAISFILTGSATDFLYQN